MTADHRAAPHAHHLRVPRTARYYTLGGGGLAPRDVWFVLHGYGQLGGTFVRYFADLATDSSLIVAPEALNRFYLVSPTDAPARDRPVGATWMTREDRESEIADYIEYLDSLYDEVASAAASDGARITVFGFSQGAATATRWVTHGRSRVNRLVLWGGLIPPDAEVTRWPVALRGARLTLVAGKRDHYISEAMFAAEQVRLDAAHVPYDAISFEGGHVISRAVLLRLAAADLTGVSGSPPSVT